ncbi:MAG: chemotaxis protein CheW [Thiohalomonadales bacterium]|nr:chemotaxis protein CheW [Thiohalomonadales bacterium]
MNAVRSHHPYELLREIEHRSQTQALGIPQQIEVRRTWSGIGFRLGDTKLVAPMGEVGEILEYPDLTQVPSARAWVKGIANIRGSLLPIMDLNGFITGDLTHLQRRSRVLVMRRGGMNCGLLVDEVLGLRHFFEEEKLTSSNGVTDELQKFVDGAYRQGEQTWGIFSTRKLADNPQFMEVTARN